MSRRRSAVATIVVLGIFGWCYVFALAVPIRTGDAYSIWFERGLAWFGAVVTRLLDGLSFLWGSMVKDEYAAPPDTPWPTVFFVVLVAVLVHVSLRNGSGSPWGAAGRVVGACVLAAGFTNLLLVTQATVKLAAAGSAPFSQIAPPQLDDAVWLGIVLGLVGGVAAFFSVLFAMLAGAAGGVDDGVDPADSRRTQEESSVRGGQVATWGVLPLLLVVLVGGFVWDYGPDADPDAVREPGATWVRMVWFAHARFAAPSDSHSLSGAFDTSVWLPRTLTSAALIVLVWIGIRLLVARWRRGDAPKAVGIVLACWGLVVVLVAVVGLVEGAVVPAPDRGPAAHILALSNVAYAIRFATCFGWIVGVSVALAHRPFGSSATAADSTADVLEGSAG